MTIASSPRSGLRAASHHDGRLTDRIDLHEWITMALQRAAEAVNGKISGGLAFLATVGSVAPFVGLFGTVMGILNALIAIGIAGQASIDKRRGTGRRGADHDGHRSGVAVPAVLGYNWLLRRNKGIQDNIRNFSSDLHAYLVGGSRVGGPTGDAVVVPRKAEQTGPMRAFAIGPVENLEPAVIRPARAGQRLRKMATTSRLTRKRMQ